MPVTINIKSKIIMNGKEYSRLLLFSISGSSAKCVG
jgi:hypothetical protein